MSKELSALLTLLRAGLWGREVDNKSLFPLTAEQWQRVFSISLEQTVAGIVYEGVMVLEQEYMPEEELMVRWVAQIDVIERNSEKNSAALCSLYEVFIQEGLNPLVQKGQSVALMYNKPALRSSGDIDLWFSPQQWSRAESVAQRIGQDFQRRADGSVNYIWQGVVVEHHPQLFDLNNPFKRAWLDAFQQEQSVLSREINLRGQSILSTSALATLLLLNSHILKHAMGLGIGLRQLCDMARAYFTLHDSVTLQQVQRLYAKAGIGRWSELLHSFLLTHIGLEQSKLPYPLTKNIDPRPLLDIVAAGGNFGMYLENRSTKKCEKSKKIDTLHSFIRRAGFSMRYAPLEAVAMIGKLFWGQFR